MNDMCYFLFVLVVLAPICHGAWVTLLGGTSLTGPVTTNSVLADISLEDGLAVSYSQTDSQISLAPFDDDWAAVDEGTLVGDLTVVSGASNIVSVLFGDADDPFSADNDFTAFATNRVLGAQKFAYIGYEEGIGNVVEIRGDVHPQNFNARIEFQRDSIARSTCVFTTNGTPVYSYVNQSIPRRTEPEGNDECVEAFGDYNPPPNGHVYDVDTPGFPNYFLTAYPNGHYFLVRMNFAQYAVYNGRRCANDFLWFSRTTVIRAMQNGHYGFDFLNRNGRMDDNVSGTGSTDILW